MIRVVLVDDQTLLRDGLSGLLALTPDIRVVAQAADGDEAVSVITEHRPDVVLLDVRMPKQSGPQVLRSLRAAGYTPPTILLTTFDDDEALMEGMKAGARGFLLKDVTFERLTESVRTVARGETVIRPAVTERVLRTLDEKPPRFDSLDPPDPLTRREIEILRLMAGGYSNKEIADAFGTSEGTIKNHASNIFSKLGVRDRTRAVLKGIDLGYV